ncbi:MAG TPA: UDP-N-acetylmuramate dehydrogenase [Candidatus Limnocylindria bacterium]|jgi:UDP-N-acetylenolpyruvoylglucosamine reductase|nr:UDP-N-acetylmuramate dehydrogenase [Candidatus Limnocylindria bacterium]
MPKLLPSQDEAELEATLGRVESVVNLFSDYNKLLVPGTVLRRDEALAKRTTLRVGGPADIYVEPVGEEALSTVIQYARLRSVPYFVLGRGSNLLVRDGGIRGVVISLNHPNFANLTIENGKVTAGAGVKLKHLSNETRRAGLAGFEFLEGIPGSLGGALRMNAGAMGRWTFEVVETVRLVDSLGEIREYPSAAMQVEYRNCGRLKHAVAVGAVLRGLPDNAAEIKGRMDKYSQKRWDSQPNQPSAGCTFKNPRVDLPAGRLIDELGLKGLRVGDAMVSDIHANFFVNLGNATAADVLSLIAEVKRRALEQRGVSLETEVEIVGED